MPGMEEKELRLLGASCRTAPVEVRESLSHLVAETEARFLPDEPEELELVVLSTCNRTEIYTWAPIQTDYLDRWFRQIADSLRPGSASSNETLYHLRGESAARHLFRVACGLDSAVLGDVQILSQIKQARTAAKEARRLGVFLERLFQVAIQAGKRARHESEIGYGAASVGSALASMLRRRSKSGSFRILLIGAGNAARNIGLHLAKSELGSIVCINRTRHKANELARRLGGESRPWDELEPALLESDLVIAATSAAEPVLQKNDLEELAQRRGGEPILIVDAGLPRNMEPGSPLDVIGIDEVRERQEQVMARRRASVPLVERIIQDAVEEWRRWLASRPIEEIVRSLFQELPSYTKRAAARLVDGGVLTTEAAERILTKSIRQLLHDHVHRLRTLVVPEQLVTAGLPTKPRESSPRSHLL